MKPARQARKGGPPTRWRSQRSRKRWTIGLVLGLLVAAVGAGAWWWTSRPGEVAPAFALPASTGQTVRLEDYRGKQPVVLAFYMFAG